MKPITSSRHSAFTLIELLIVIGIIAVIAGILLGVTGQVRERADRTSCLNNLHQIGVAALAFEGDNNGSLPGPCDPGQKIYYTTNMMCANLAPYLGLPAQPTNVIVPIFRCPTWQRIAQQPKKSDDNIICYVIDKEIKLANGPTIPINGTSASSNGNDAVPPCRASVLASLEGQALDTSGTSSGATATFSMTTTMYLTDCDQMNWSFDKSASWYSALPAKPVHGNIRNTLFFDMHAEARNATLIPN